MNLVRGALELMRCEKRVGQFGEKRPPQYFISFLCAYSNVNGGRIKSFGLFVS
jgi:hypothetical protein